MYLLISTSLSRLTVAAVVVLSLGLLSACGGELEQQEQEQSLLPVTVTTLQAQNVEHFGQFTARLRGAREVDVRAQVSGILQERGFIEGEVVEQGQTLFQIDPEPYEIQVSSARAQLSEARAFNKQAQSEWQRVKGLYEQDATSRRQYDLAESESETAKARVSQAESALADAERNLRYTRVESPVTGLSGIESFSEGNLVDMGAMLTHVTQTDTLEAHFSLPEALAYFRRQQMHKYPDMQTFNNAWAVMPDGSEYEHTGEINFVDNRVNETSATVAMRAEFVNPDNLLIPGQFIRVRVLLHHYENAFLIEPSAVNQGPEGALVYVVNNDTAEQRVVELGPEVAGKQVVTEGLSEGDELVINGHVALADGAAVNPSYNGDEE